MFDLPEGLGQLIILLAFLIPPLVAVLKGLLKLSKRAASVAVIVLCIIAAAVGGILTGNIEAGEAIRTVVAEVLEISVWVLIVAFGLYKMIYQSLGLEEWIVHKTGGNID